MLRLSLLLLLPMTISGCWDQDEVNHVGFIIAAGIDSTQEDMVHLTIQVFIPNPTSGGPDEGGGEGRLFTYMCSGKSIPDALSSLQNKLPRTLSWDHTKLFIFGEKLATLGLKDDLDFLFRDVESREQANFLICKGTAEKLLNSLDDPNTYDTLIRIGEMPSVNAYNMNYVEESISGESGSFVLPIADTMSLSSSKTTRTVLTVKGTAVIKDAKLIGIINDQKNKGLQLGFQWLHQTSLSRNLTITLKQDGGKITAKLVRRKLKLLPSIRDGVWRIKIRLKLDADIVQNSSSIDLLTPADSLRALETRFNDEIEKYLLQTLDEVQTNMNADVIGFARTFHKIYPRQWKKVSGDWDSVFQKIEVTMDVNCTLRKPGIADIKM
ncbi:Ger(x)C family spore germination protein [Cohnella lupini]|uniref:Ger(x)C family spore germination protein n=1 Tax=Cohnella lupini TaxID=1294267 RepID=UPI0015F270BD|nr:Ger(x)C family spore germination protein [Cohnella lupini]